MKKKITTDLSKLTNIDEKVLDKLSELTMYLISEAVYETSLNMETITELDMGYGDLIIKNGDGELKIRFIPKPELELDIRGVNKGGQPTLKKRIEKTLIAKLVDMYKEII